MKKRSLRALAAVLLVICAVTGFSLMAHADEFKILSAKSRVVTGVDKNYGCLIDLSSKLKGMKDGTVSVSNSKVIKNAWFDVMDMTEYNGKVNLYLTFMPVKKGTSKITVSGTIGGKKASFTTTVKVVNYQNPFSVLKLGSKSYKKKFKKYANSVVARTSAGKPKLTVKPAAGWKLSSVKYSPFGTLDGKAVKTKSGKKISLYSGGTIITFTLKNSKTKVTEKLSLIVNPEY